MLSFSFSSTYFVIPLVISLMYWLFRSVLFNIHIFANVPNILLFLISNFILLWLDNKLSMISILLNLVRLILWPSIWTSLENVLIWLSLVKMRVIFRAKLSFSNIVLCILSSSAVNCLWDITIYWVRLNSSMAPCCYVTLLQKFNWIIKRTF